MTRPRYLFTRRRRRPSFPAFIGLVLAGFGAGCAVIELARLVVAG